MSNTESKKKNPGCFLYTAAFFLAMILFASIGEWLINIEDIWPHLQVDIIPFSFFELWKTENFWEGLKSATPIFIFGAVATTVLVLLTRNSPKTN